MGWRKLTVPDRDDGSGALRRGSATHHLRGPTNLRIVLMRQHHSSRQSGPTPVWSAHVEFDCAAIAAREMQDGAFSAAWDGITAHAQSDLPARRDCACRLRYCHNFN